MDKTNNYWKWKQWDIAWSKSKNPPANSNINILLIHGFGASQRHWRNNQEILGSWLNCYSIDLLGFGESSQPFARLDHEKEVNHKVKYCFDLWSEQIADFCVQKINGPTFLIGNSIGGIVALKAAEILKQNCQGLILINCAQRLMDDKRLKKNDVLMNFLRPLLKTLVRQRFISNTLFRRAANPKIIEKILKKAYPSGKNIDEELIRILYEPAKRKNSPEAFRGFINLFDDYLATDLFDQIKCNIHLIWGENDPWEALSEAKEWEKNFKNIKSLDIIKNAGHCPHDENPALTNKLILDIIQETK